jgi:predicted  nucleic acid-binding Zn-ribbon protein
MILPHLRDTVLVLCALSAAAAANAAPPGPRDPDWPCQQIKMPQLSLASVWSGPPLDQQQTDWRQDQQVVDLVHDVTQRRVPIAQAQDRVRAFAQQTGEQRQPRLLEVLAGSFSVLDEERSAVMAGLDRFGARQKELAAAIRDDNEKLRALQANASADPAEVDRMVQQVTWDAEVFRDRRQALSYACDVPAKIEQRLYELAKTIRQEMQ